MIGTHFAFKCFTTQKNDILEYHVCMLCLVLILPKPSLQILKGIVIVIE